MSQPRRSWAGRLRRAPSRTAARLLVSALIVVGGLLAVRASATAPLAASGRADRGDVCVGPVPVGGTCSSTSTSSRGGTRATTTTTSTTSTSSQTGTATETTTSTTGEATTTTESAEPAGTTSTETGGARAPATSSPAPATHFPPPPPPLPPPSPGAAPVPPESAVQRIVLVPAASGPIAPGDRVTVQATLEAQRGTDIYAVPHLSVTFALLSSAGGGAAVTPPRTTSGDSGVATVVVRTGDRPGDTVVSATAGAASAQLTLHTEAPISGAAALVSPPLTAGRPASSGGRIALVGVLVVAGVLAAMILGLRRRPRSQRG